jgi:hypothetical protein
MINKKDVSEKYHLNLTIKDIDIYYNFFDDIAEYIVGSNEVRIRQVTNHDELIKLSSARKRMYGKRDNYFSSLYSGEYYLDSTDYKSYIFACYYRGEIVGIQRASDHDFEIKQYIDDQSLCRYLGDNFSDNYLEFSRLVVDKDVPLKGIANALSFVTGSMIALATEYDNYMTYSKPKLRRKSLDLEKKTLSFSINSRDNNVYELYKGTVSKDIGRVFSVPGDTREAVLNNFRANIINSNMDKKEAHSC